MRRLALLTGIALLLTACGERSSPPPPSPAPPDAGATTASTVDPAELARQRGVLIVQQAFTMLSSNLARAIQTGGISNALSYCSVKALPLTQLVGDTNRVRLRRVTHKPRNPANRASAAELGILAGFQSALAAGRTNPPPVLTTNDAGGLSLHAPIVLNNPLCLNCHGRPGDQILPENVTLLARLYPTDEATGFTLGDLRGMWCVDFAGNVAVVPPGEP
ncbi:MAG: DUF3365 domain-containing protein [Verrucomicrobiales bacterium]|nr:DUF3365 domain-containing protein [Verrucomicrobiales bacterium]